jgi:hypothetical protein
MDSESRRPSYLDLFVLLGLGAVLLVLGCFWAMGGNIGYQGRIFLSPETHPVLFWGSVIVFLLIGSGLVICSLHELHALRRWEREYEREIVDACHRQRSGSQLERNEEENQLFL